MTEDSQKAGEIVKRSVLVAGHRTSVSLEAAFWEELKRASARENLSLNALITRIDSERKGNLSSALRLYVLDVLKTGVTRDPVART